MESSEVKLPPLPCLCASVRQLSRMLTQRYDEALRPSGLRATQFSILMTVQGMGEPRLRDLEAYLDMDQTTLTRSLALLERTGLLARAKSEDRREKRVRLSPAGKRKLERAMSLWTGVQDKFRDALGAGLWTRVFGDLAKVREATESAKDAASR